jgi:hypothetical protein
MVALHRMKPAETASRIAGTYKDHNFLFQLKTKAAPIQSKRKKNHAPLKPFLISPDVPCFARLSAGTTGLRGNGSNSAERWVTRSGEIKKVLAPKACSTRRALLTVPDSSIGDIKHKLHRTRSVMLVIPNNKPPSCQRRPIV